MRICRLRNALMPGSSVGPSTPQFQERLLELPSLLFSPLASLCFSLYVTESLSVKPSCAVMKLIEDHGRRPCRLNVAALAQSFSTSAEALASPR